MDIITVPFRAETQRHTHEDKNMSATTLDLLLSVPYFSELEEQVLEAIARALAPWSYTQGQIRILDPRTFRNADHAGMRCGK